MLFDRRYVFNANAVAAAAHIRRFKDKPVELETWFEGSAALPPTGGSVRSHSAAKVIQHPEYGFILSFDRAHASIAGDFTDTTLAFEQTQELHLDRLSPARVVTEVSISKLNVQNRLKIHHLELRTVSDDASDDKPKQFSVPSLPRMIDVEIDGKPVVINIDEVLLKFPNKTALQEEYERSPEFRRLYESRFFTQNGKTEEGKIPLIGGYAVASVVRLAFPHGMPGGAKLANDHTVVLNNFGKIVFGEMFLGDRCRMMTLVRLQMGSDTGGDASFCYSGPGGGDPLP